MANIECADENIEEVKIDLDLTAGKAYNSLGTQINFAALISRRCSFASMFSLITARPTSGMWKRGRSEIKPLSLSLSSPPHDMSSSFSPFSHLSQEVIDQVIDSLLDTGEPELGISNFYACALVCRSFRHRSQKHIFHSTTILNTSSAASCEDRVDSFHGVLQANPRIASYVRRLHLDIDSVSEWAVDDPVFLQIMKLVTQNWAVGMQLELSVTGGWDNFQFTCNRTFETQFVKPFVTPFITSLDLQDVFNVPISLIAHCPHLVELKLIYVTVEAARPPHAIGIDHSMRPRPLEFTFKYWEETIQILAEAYIDFSHLQRLSASGYHSKELHNTNRILATCCSSLERLELAFEEFDGGLSDVYDLGRIPNLAFLSVSTVGLTYKDDFTNLYNLLRTIPSGKNKMKTIVLAFKSYLGAPWSLAAHLRRLETGSSLIAVLVKIAEREPLMVKFRLDIKVDFGEYFSDEEGEDGEKYKEGPEIKKQVNEEMPSWVTKNLELMTQLSANIALEYDYKFRFPR
ncbi:hypothetical protein GALMADRAFT_141006 [Galerina marginata CBS 339.88]|uniref:F-box domain-containing protein n=1 Tax=Galerina marginata (strain CBS 339.88) TaxID=685588 RepID=A0A067SUM7_GALM3|nr:hypothetical protein GALMADRAFT_141006 [Galerina marginata CBS 339.88]